MLSLLFVAMSLQASAIHRIKKKTIEQAMTVAAIRPENKEETFITVIFNESARFYKLSKNANPAYLKLLKQSEGNHKQVLVKRSNEKSDVILGVRKK